jgi:hypothetical protein
LKLFLSFKIPIFHESYSKGLKTLNKIIQTSESLKSFGISDQKILFAILEWSVVSSLPFELNDQVLLERMDSLPEELKLIEYLFLMEAHPELIGENIIKNLYGIVVYLIEGPFAGKMGELLKGALDVLARVVELPTSLGALVEESPENDLDVLIRELEKSIQNPAEDRALTISMSSI